MRADEEGGPFRERSGDGEMCRAGRRCAGGVRLEKEVRLASFFGVSRASADEMMGSVRMSVGEQEGEGDELSSSAGLRGGEEVVGGTSSFITLRCLPRSEVLPSRAEVLLAPRR